MITHRLSLTLALLALAVGPTRAADLPKVKNVELQPLAAQAKRIADALEFLGAPLSDADKKALTAAADAVAVQDVLDKHCLAGVRISDVKPFQLQALAGAAKPELAEQGWRVVLIKVLNPQGVDTVELRAESPNALPLHARSSGRPDPKVQSVGEVGKRFLDLQ